MLKFLGGGAMFIQGATTIPDFRVVGSASYVGYKSYLAKKG